MDIIYQDIEIFESVHYKDGCTKKTKIYEMYNPYFPMDTPVFKFKIVRFILRDGTIDGKRSHNCRKLFDENEEVVTKYKELDFQFQMEVIIDYEDGCSKTIELTKI